MDMGDDKARAGYIRLYSGEPPDAEGPATGDMLKQQPVKNCAGVAAEIMIETIRNIITSLPPEGVQHFMGHYIEVAAKYHLDELCKAELLAVAVVVLEQGLEDADNMVPPSVH